MLLLTVAVLIVYTSRASGELTLSNNLSRIYGGAKAEPGQFPFMVSYQRNREHLCGATILNERWIVTAAHCIRKLGNIAVVAGTVLLSSPGVEYQIEESIIHPDFGASGERFGNDIALLKTKKNIDFSDNVTSVLLPEKDIDVGTNVTIAGWGYTEEQIKSDNLLYYTARTVDLEECRKQLQISISDEDLCAFSRKGQGVCYGDSGSLLIDTESRVLHGIVSRGIPCAVGKPDIFTGVYSYIEWIKSYIE